MSGLGRRDLLKAGLFGAAGLAGVAAAARTTGGARLPQGGQQDDDGQSGGHAHLDNGVVGDVDITQFDPTAFLTAFETGQLSALPSGQPLREYKIVAVDREVEIAPGVYFPAWTYNGQVPGPTFRCTEGDRLRFQFHNGGSHPHTIHFHGIHPPAMDGVTPMIQPGESFTYEFDARPFGLHVYHCHAIPLKRHIHKGLYGNFIIDPPGGREPAHEMSMVMNAFDTNFDGENEVYAVNTVAFHYAKHPIQVKVGELVRLYLSNLTEFDPINSLHLHAGMYHVYRTGTRLGQWDDYTDMIMMSQGERHVIEFKLEYPGMYMFHAHQSEFAELGWMGFFEAVA